MTSPQQTLTEVPRSIEAVLARAKYDNAIQPKHFWEAMVSVKLEPKAFIEWLEDRSPSDVVGHACDGGGCPLWSWISQMFPGQVVVYGEGVLEWTPPFGGFAYRVSYTMAGWTAEFIEAVDNFDEDETEEAHTTPITAAQCLEVMTRLLLD